MIEAIMFFGLGFFLACLLALIVLPLVHARAVRLTKRRIEAMTPVSIAEIQADKDHLRAEFAVAARQLELNPEHLKAKAASQLADVGRKTETVARLQAQLEEKTAALDAVKGAEGSLQQQLLSASEEVTQKTALLEATQKTLAEKEAELASAQAALAEATATRDSQRVELVAAHTQLDTVRDRVRQLERQIGEKEETIGERGGAIDAAAHALTEMKRERDALQAEIEGTRELERQLQAERAKLAEDAAASRREVEKIWEAERAENAELRERIADVAAEVARLTMQLEGAASPIPALLAAEDAGKQQASANGASDAPALAPAAGDMPTVSLADRIRALQNKAARVASSA